MIEKLEEPVSNATKDLIPVGYKEFLNDLKEKVKRAQLKAAISVNQELIKLYWDIGRSIVSIQKTDK